jgi:hypothetical protein
MQAAISTSPAFVQPRQTVSAVSRASVALGLTFWAAALLSLTLLSLNYEFTHAPDTQAPQTWPRDSELVQRSGPTLLLFLHPCCPCSRATLGELAQVLTHLPPSGRAYCLVTPLRADKDSSHTSLVELARKLPRLKVVMDSQGAESCRFGAQASGCVLLYDGAGQLQFTGGVTPARGHAGANLGSSALIALLAGQPSAITQTPVFGCQLPRLQPATCTLQLPTDASDR